MTEVKHKPFNEEQFKNTITAVIDGDGIAWAVGWNHKDDLFPEPALAEVDAFMHDTLQGVQARHYIGILSPRTEPQLEDEEWKRPLPNFRFAVATSRPYKGNRKEKPEWYERWAPVIEAYLRDTWGFIHAPESFEADDLCATMAVHINKEGNCTLVHTDKDLNQVPGNHFNPVKKMLYHVTKEQSYYNLYTQVIAGDNTDNIEGIPGWGPKAAENTLTKLMGTDCLEATWMGTVTATYIEAYHNNCDVGMTKFYENYMLCKLRTDIGLNLIDEDALRGYDLDGFADWNQPGPEQHEDIPDFSAGLND